MNIAVIGLKGAWSTESLAQHLRAKEAGGQVIEMSEIAFDFHGGRANAQGTDLRRFDGIIIKKMGRSYSPRLLDELDLLSHLERQGLPFFSSPEKLRNMISRLGCTIRLQEAGIPMPETLVTESVDGAASWIENIGPVVFKPLYSTKARGMQILSPGPELTDQLKVIVASGEEILYLQKVVDLQGQDHGLVFLNGAHVGAYSRCGDGNSWNTTTVSGGKYRPYEPDPSILAIADKAQKVFGLDFSSVDVAITPEGPIVFEVSAFGGYRGLYETTGIDASDRLTDHVMESIQKS